MQRFPSISNLIPTLWVIAWSLFSIAMHQDGQGDLPLYLEAGRTGKDFYYTYTILPLFALLSHAPYAVAALTMQLSAVAGLYTLAKQFNRPFFPAFYSFPFVALLIYSQITGLLYLGLGLAWLASRHGKWMWFGAGVVLATIKPQWGVPLLIMILMDTHPINIKDWLAIAVAPALAGLVSLLLYGWWPLALVEFIVSTPPRANASLWALLGPGVALLWLMCLYGYASLARLQMAIGCLPLATPYMTVYDMSLAWLFLPWWASVATWAVFPLFMLIGRDVFALLMVLPAWLFVVNVWIMMKSTWEVTYERRAIDAG